jgi:hypothetical protein
LFNPPEFKPPPPPKLKLREKIKKTVADRKTMVKELDAVCKLRKDAMELEGLFKNVKQVDVIARIPENCEVAQRRGHGGGRKESGCCGRRERKGSRL